MQMRILPVLLLATLAISISGLASVAYAEEAAGDLGSSDGSKLIGAGLAFGLAAMGAGTVSYTHLTLPTICSV